MGTHWEWLKIVNLSPFSHRYSLVESCRGYNSLPYVMGAHWECLKNCLFVSIMSWVLIGSVLTIVFFSPLCHGYSLGVSCKWSICLHYVISTHWACLDYCLFLSIMSYVLIGSVFRIVYLSPLCHGYSLVESCRWYNSLHYVMGAHWECLKNCLFVSIMSWVHWECLDHCLFLSIMSWVLIGSVLQMVYLSPLCHGYSLGVSWLLSISLHFVIGTH